MKEDEKAIKKDTSKEAESKGDEMPKKKQDIIFLVLLASIGGAIILGGLQVVVASIIAILPNPQTLISGGVVAIIIGIGLIYLVLKSIKK